MEHTNVWFGVESWRKKWHLLLWCVFGRSSTAVRVQHAQILVWIPSFAFFLTLKRTRHISSKGIASIHWLTGGFSLIEVFQVIMAWRLEVLRFVPHLNRAKQQWPSRKSVKTMPYIVILTWTFQKKTLIVWWIFCGNWHHWMPWKAWHIHVFQPETWQKLRQALWYGSPSCQRFSVAVWDKNSPFQENHG